VGLRIDLTHTECALFVGDDKSESEQFVLFDAVQMARSERQRGRVHGHYGHVAILGSVHVIPGITIINT
jgi:hypothetical protein